MVIQDDTPQYQDIVALYPDPIFVDTDSVVVPDIVAELEDFLGDGGAGGRAIDIYDSTDDSDDDIDLEDDLVV